MQLLQRLCGQALEKAPLDLWPSEPIASSEVPKHPGLIQWLALADSLQCAPLVESCLSQLLCQESDEAIHEAVASPHLRPLIDGLRPETKTSFICKMAGMPLGFQVLMAPGGLMCHMHVTFGCINVYYIATNSKRFPSISVLPILARDVSPRSTGCGQIFHTR